jgi:hypothetical protein
MTNYRGYVIAKTAALSERGISTAISEYVRSSPGGVVKSLALIGAGPVVLVHTQKVGIKYKKPLRDDWHKRIAVLTKSAWTM